MTAISSTGTGTPLRARNRRGEGGLLRDEILRAAVVVLEQSGSEEAVTLRAVARQAGIAAPSIYQHFANREAVLDAVVAQAFGDLIVSFEADRAGITDPRERLWTGCRTYVRFAAEHPQRYRIMFGRSAAPAGGGGRSIPREMPAEAAQSLDYLTRGIAECAAAGVSDSVDFFADAVALWVSLHGLATLECFIADGWPTRPELLDALVGRVARFH